MADSLFAVEGLGSHPLVLTPNSARRAEILDDVVHGRRVCAFALTEPEAGSDVASKRTTARREGDHYVLDGEKVFISNVGIAHQSIVFANADPSGPPTGRSPEALPLTVRRDAWRPSRGHADDGARRWNDERLNGARGSGPPPP